MVEYPNHSGLRGFQQRLGTHGHLRRSQGGVHHFGLSLALPVGLHVSQHLAECVHEPERERQSVGVRLGLPVRECEPVAEPLGVRVSQCESIPVRVDQSERLALGQPIAVSLTVLLAKPLGFSEPQLQYFALPISVGIRKPLGLGLTIEKSERLAKPVVLGLSLCRRRPLRTLLEFHPGRRRSSDRMAYRLRDEQWGPLPKHVRCPGWGRPDLSTLSVPHGLGNLLRGHHAIQRRWRWHDLESSPDPVSLGALGFAVSVREHQPLGQ
jgi:hypothetical protein